ncbi:MAG: hypothetical protein EA390_00855 [Balneolaceae bacterium]|jgi:putative transposase|nr:MAG: hypothetical protein EA390_00855 [Balneolaceae bacterium]
MEIIEEGFYYHIYNRGADRKNLFWDDEDYKEFIKKFDYYLYPSVQTFAWCLLSNHFHALIRIRTVQEQSSIYSAYKNLFLTGKYHGSQDPTNKPFIASNQISHFMNSYTRYINKKRERTGTLIEGPLKRKKVIDETNFLHLVCYIHRNPIHHGIVKDYCEYRYSSFPDFLNGRKSFIETSEVLMSFGGTENFIHAHEEFKLNTDNDSDIYLE